MPVVLAPRLDHDEALTTRFDAEKGGMRISDFDPELAEAGLEMFGREELDETALPVADGRATAVALDDNVAIYDDVGHVLIMLNSSASAVWGMCDGSTRAGDIVGHLSEEYEATETEIRSDVWLTLLKLASLGLVSDAR